MFNYSLKKKKKKILLKTKVGSKKVLATDCIKTFTLEFIGDSMIVVLFSSCKSFSIFFFFSTLNLRIHAFNQI